MDAIRIKNLRNLSDTAMLEIRPITLLLGKNGSGKSTFLRVFPLLRQSVESRTTGPILWYGPLVDFGSFDESLMRNTSEDTISLQFAFVLKPALLRPYYFNHRMSADMRSQQKVSVRLDLKKGSKKELTFVTRCVLTFADHSIEMEFNQRGMMTRLMVNDSDLSDLASDYRMVAREGLLPSIREYFGTITRVDQRLANSFFEQTVGKLRKLLHRNTKDSTIKQLADRLRIGSSSQMLRAMQSIKRPPATGTWQEITDSWGTDHRDFKELRNLVVADSLPALLYLCDEHLTRVARGVRYIAPLRATAQRYYRLQGLDVDEVDFQGQNLAMLLRNIPGVEGQRFRQWMEQHFGFYPTVSADLGHISMHVVDAESGEEFNLADMGFGYSQVLPILTQLWLLIQGRTSRFGGEREGMITFAIEQPELHLHPSLQAKLTDAMVSSIAEARDSRVTLRLLIETHSETIVNRFGHLVAGGKLDPKDIAVIVFDRKYPGELSHIHTSRYDEQGFLVDWPLGFFEPEASIK